MKLTIKQEKFALFIFQGMKQSEAYTKAGYTCKAITTANSAACRLAKDVNIRKRLEELRLKAETSRIMSVNERREMLTLIARFGGKLSIPAIAELNKMGGDYAPIKTDVTSKGEAIKAPVIVQVMDLETKELFLNGRRQEPHGTLLETNEHLQEELPSLAVRTTPGT